LALCYENGIGIEKSREDALALYKLAADQGFEEAQSKLDFYNDIEDASNEETNERDNRVETSSDASQNNLNISRAEKEEQTEQEKSREEGVAAKLKELELKEQSTGKREAMLKETEELLQEKHHHIKLIELEIATRVETVLSREKTVEAKEKEIQNSEEELQHWDLEMQEKEAELREKSNRLLAHEREAENAREPNEANTNVLAFDEVSLADIVAERDEEGNEVQSEKTTQRPGLETHQSLRTLEKKLSFIFS